MNFRTPGQSLSEQIRHSESLSRTFDPVVTTLPGKQRIQFQYNPLVTRPLPVLSHWPINNIAVTDVPLYGCIRFIPLGDYRMTRRPIKKRSCRGLRHSAVSNGYKEEEKMPNKSPLPTGISLTNSNQPRSCRAGGRAQRSARKKYNHWRWSKVRPRPLVVRLSQNLTCFRP